MEIDTVTKSPVIEYHINLSPSKSHYSSSVECVKRYPNVPPSLFILPPCSLMDPPIVITEHSAYVRKAFSEPALSRGAAFSAF